MANNNKKPEGGKAQPKIETINLQVFIHCEACKKKVKRILHSVEGVRTVDIDGTLRKVTVTGTVDPCVLIKKLERSNKIARIFPSPAGKGKDQQKGVKGDNNEGKESKNEGNGTSEDSDKKENNENSGGSGKKKKGGGGPNPSNAQDENVNTINKNIATIGVQTGYLSMGSAEYATHMFSDENANNCHIM
ncbi:hypothetical protein KP509_17G073300 [Ceratopteris richardii]|uniref:HMA domain-containing protein n=1 Tax=Ceratopteris richardii TaxID=49495 RepID=A0A8T2SW34_CERRI|nr:hypothetical protein KP509_17G073300 [Ceratopteris richardii]